MRRAKSLLAVFISCCALLLTAAPAYAAPAPVVPLAQDAPVGRVYTVGGVGADPALTVVDHSFDGQDQADIGVQFDGGSRYYYGAVISGVTYGAVIDSVDTGYFGSSSGTIPLYDPSGTATGVVWGSGRPTEISAQTGLLLRGDIADCLLVDDATSVEALDAVLLYEPGTGRVSFNNAHLYSDNGLLLDTAEDAAGELALSFSNGSYEGTLQLSSGDVSLSVTVGQGALLHGDVVTDATNAELTVAAGGAWAPTSVSHLSRLQVEQGACVYAHIEDSDGVLTLRPGGEALDAGTYEAVQPLAETLPFGHGPAAGPAQEEVPDQPDLDAAGTASAAGDALGLSLAARISKGALPARLDAAVISRDLSVRLAMRAIDQFPIAAIVRETLRNSHSFLRETIDKPAIILYNPYCCLAA